MIVAYNAFMSGVDCLDQKRATNATKRREKKVYMSIFTYVLDLACPSSFFICINARKNKGHEKLFKFVEFKQQIAQDLVTPWHCVTNKATPEKWTGLCLDSQRKETLPKNLYLPQPLPKQTPKKRTTNDDVEGQTNPQPSPKQRMLPVQEVMGTNLHTHSHVDSKC
jgi:hypothetical protein